MPTADEHLRTVLEEYNDTVADLEDEGDVSDLIDAYINRGMILSMMESYVSALTDFDDAIELMEELEAEGGEADAGSWVRAFVSRGGLQGKEEVDAMVRDYAMAASRLKLVGPGSRHLKEWEIPEICDDCACDLIDAGMHADALPFTRKALSCLSGKDDIRSRNDYLRACNLEAEAQAEGDPFESERFTRRAVSTGEALLEEGGLDDREELVFAHVALGSICENRGDYSEAVSENERAIEILEDMRTKGMLDNDDLLCSMHGHVAEILMDRGESEDAERHLLRQVYLSSDSSQYCYPYR